MPIENEGIASGTVNQGGRFVRETDKRSERRGNLLQLTVPNLGQGQGCWCMCYGGTTLCADVSLVELVKLSWELHHIRMLAKA